MENHNKGPKTITKLIEYLLATFLALVVPMLIINFSMDFGWFKSVGHGSDDGWLGFWGGYLGAVVSIGGLYWQVHAEIRNSNEAQYKEARPIFILNIMDGTRRQKNNGSMDYNVLPIEPITYVSEECCKACNYSFGWCGDLISLPYIQLKNISERPMLAVKVNLIWADDSNELFNISRIDSDSNISLLNAFTYDYYHECTGKHPTSVMKIKLRELKYVKLYYLTSQNEKIFMKFKIKKGYRVPNLIEKKLEGKGDHFDPAEYQIDNFVESKKLNDC